MQMTPFNGERDYENERVASVVFHFSPQQSAVVLCLIKNPVVSSKQLADYVGCKTNIKIVVSQARSKLKEMGFDIKSRVNLGYWLEPEDKNAIEKMITEFATA